MITSPEVTQMIIVHDRHILRLDREIADLKAQIKELQTMILPENFNDS